MNIRKLLLSILTLALCAGAYSLTEKSYLAAAFTSRTGDTNSYIDLHQILVDGGFDLKGIEQEGTGAKVILNSDLPDFSPIDTEIANWTGIDIPVHPDGFSVEVNGEIVDVAFGTADQVLKSNGASSAPSFQDGTIVFASSEQTITSAGSLTIAHGLSSIPDITTVRMIMDNVAGANGYSEDDILIYPDAAIANNSVTNRGISIVIDATNLNIRYGSGTSVFRILNKTTGAAENAINSDWKIVFVAIKF